MSRNSLPTSQTTQFIHFQYQLQKEIIDVYSENKKSLNTLCGQTANTRILGTKPGDIPSYNTKDYKRDLKTIIVNMDLTGLGQVRLNAL